MSNFSMKDKTNIIRRSEYVCFVVLDQSVIVIFMIPFFFSLLSVLLRFTLHQYNSFYKIWCVL